MLQQKGLFGQQTRPKRVSDQVGPLPSVTLYHLTRWVPQRVSILTLQDCSQNQPHLWTGRYTLKRSEEKVTISASLASSVMLLSSFFMPRPILYKTPAERKQANRAKSARHYARYRFHTFQSPLSWFVAETRNKSIIAYVRNTLLAKSITFLCCSLLANQIYSSVDSKLDLVGFTQDSAGKPIMYVSVSDSLSIITQFSWIVHCTMMKFNVCMTLSTKLLTQHLSIILIQRSKQWLILDCSSMTVRLHWEKNSQEFRTFGPAVVI